MRETFSVPQGDGHAPQTVQASLPDEAPQASLANQCEALAGKFADGEIIPFLGAGASSYQGRFPQERPPNAVELAARLASLAGLETGAAEGAIAYDLPRVASYYQLVAQKRSDLDKEIRRLTGSAHYRPNRLHRVLARAAREKPMLIITTNYDMMMETALHDVGAEYQVVATAADRLAYAEPTTDEAEDQGLGPIGPGGMIYHKADHDSDFAPIEPRQLEFDLTRRSVVYKVHGSVPAGVHWDGGYLVAEEDYARFLGRMDREYIFPHKIKNIIGRKRPVGRAAELVNSLLYLGYSLNDWNLRVLMDQIGIGQGRSNAERHYAVMRTHCDVADELLKRRNIFPWIIDLSVFAEELDRKLTGAGFALPIEG